MNKIEVVKIIAQESELEHKQVENVINSLLNIIKELKDGERVGLGTFQVKAVAYKARKFKLNGKWGEVAPRTKLMLEQKKVK